MIKSFISNRAIKTNQNQPVKFVFPYDHGASFEEMAPPSENTKENRASERTTSNMRICINCGENKQVSDFPLSVRKARVCRFCVVLENRGLDFTGMSCEGSAGLTVELPKPKGKHVPLAHQQKQECKRPLRPGSDYIDYSPKKSSEEFSHFVATTQGELV